MKPYLYLAKIKIQSSIAYRFEVFSTIIMQFLVMFAVCFFWIAVYGDTESVMNVSKQNMLTYTIISSIIGCLFTAGVERRVMSSVRKGSVATDMLRPVSLYGMYLAEDLGSAIVSFFKNALPILLVGSITFGLPKPASGSNFLLFLLSFVLSYTINWLFAAIFSMWAFVVISMGPMLAVKGYIISLLSGSIIPIWFFPEWLQNFLGFLPFPYIYQLPLGIYIGKYNGNTLLFQMGIQVAWIIILGFAFLMLQKITAKKVMVQGG